MGCFEVSESINCKRSLRFSTLRLLKNPKQASKMYSHSDIDEEKTKGIRCNLFSYFVVQSLRATQRLRYKSCLVAYSKRLFPLARQFEFGMKIRINCTESKELFVVKWPVRNHLRTNTLDRHMGIHKSKF